MELTGETRNERPAVVLLHSAVCDRRMWDAQVAALESRYRVLAPDLRGFGDRPHQPGPFSHAEDVLALLDSEGLERAAIVGSSFGGRVAMEVAVTAPERVTALALLCTAAPGLPQTDDVTRLRRGGGPPPGGRGPGRSRPAQRADLAGPGGRTGGPGAGRQMQARAFELDAAAEDLVPAPEPRPVDIDPSALGMPALVVGGGHDLEWFQQIARHLADTMPRAELVMLDWAGHLPSLERPGETADLVGAFLDRSLR